MTPTPVVPPPEPEGVKQLTIERDHYRDKLAEAKAELTMHRDKSRGDYWCWQGDGNDHLESLTCPVLIWPEALIPLASAESRVGEAVKAMRPFAEAHARYISDGAEHPKGHLTMDDFKRAATALLRLAQKEQPCSGSSGAGALDVDAPKGTSTTDANLPSSPNAGQQASPSTGRSESKSCRDEELLGAQPCPRRT